MLRDLQQQFRATVLGNDDAPIASFLRVEHGQLTDRIAVYRNTVQASLTDVLATAFPAVQRIMGANNFTRAARRFIAAHPPRLPHLSVYGAAFPAFLAGFEALKPLPYIADVARLEWARSEAYFAADAAPLDPARLAAIAPAALPHVTFEPHPATRLIPSPYPIHRIWTVNQPDVVDVPTVDMNTTEAVLITRPHFIVIARNLTAAETAFTQALLSGGALSDAAEQASQVSEDFDLQTALSDHLSGGTFSAAV
jgi:hypothetical protein